MGNIHVWEQVTEYKIINGAEEIREIIDLVKVQLETIDIKQIKDCEDVIEVMKYSIKLLDDNYNDYLEDTTVLLGKWFKDIMPRLLIPETVTQFNNIMTYYQEKDDHSIELINDKITNLFTKEIEKIRIEIDKDAILKFAIVVKSGTIAAKKQITDCDEAFARMDETIDLLENSVDDYFKDDMFLLGKLYSQIVQKYKKSDVNLTSQFRKILKYYNKPKPVRNSKVKALLDQLSKK